MSICVAAGAAMIVLTGPNFTLSWTHSVERAVWQEDWTVTAQGLKLLEARMKGSGAGMEPPEDAFFAHGWWVSRPERMLRHELVLAASGATGAGWQLCSGERCLELGAKPGPPIVISPCS